MGALLARSKRGRASSDGAMPRQDEIRLGRDDGPSRAPDASGVSAASRAHSTLHGVVFAILCLGPVVYRRRVSALRPGHEIIGFALMANRLGSNPSRNRP